MSSKAGVSGGPAISDIELSQQDCEQDYSYDHLQTFSAHENGHNIQQPSSSHNLPNVGGRQRFFTIATSGY